jgi:hypothetical protein
MEIKQDEKISPVLVGGLGNRLYQIFQAIAIAHIYKKIFVIQTLHPSLEFQVSQILKIQLNAFQENGGHPSKFKLKEVFEINYENEPILSSVFIQDSLLVQTPGLNKLFAEHTPIIHINGSWFHKFWFDYCLKYNLVPKFKIDFSNIKLYKNVAHLRFQYKYDSYTLDKPNFETIIQIMKTRNLEKWAILTNDTSQLPEEIKIMGDVFGPDDLDVYECLYVGSNSENLIMAPSTLSSWMAYIGNQDKKVFVPQYFINLHGIQAVDLKWTVF